MSVKDSRVKLILESAVCCAVELACVPLMVSVDSISVLSVVDDVVSPPSVCLSYLSDL